MTVMNARVGFFRGGIVSLLLRWIDKNIALGHSCQTSVDGYTSKLGKWSSIEPQLARSASISFFCSTI